MTQHNDLPLLRGTIESSQFFRNPQGGSNPIPAVMPVRNPAAHREYLLDQLNLLKEHVTGRAADERVDGAAREIITVTTEDNSDAVVDGLADKRSDVRLIAADEASHTALLDVPSAAIDLTHIRRKADQYADASRLTPNGRPRNERLIAPITQIESASVDDLAGPDFRAAGVQDGQPYWFELSCRGGTTLPREETEDSRRQVIAALADMRLPVPAEYVAAEIVLFYARLTLGQLGELIRRTSCIYEYELVSKDLRTWVLMETPMARAVVDFNLAPPPENAPSVVLLDAGILPNHPLLATAILSATSSVPGDTSPIDINGHGTEMAGVALYDDLGDVLDANESVAEHWLQSSRIIVADNTGTATEENRAFWPAITRDGILAAEIADSDEGRNRAFVLAVSSDSDRGKPTSWSTALEDAAFNEGNGRCIFVAIGNCDVTTEIVESYPHGNRDHFVDDPAQAANVVTVGGTTFRCELPPEMNAYNPIAPEGGVSPITRAGVADSLIKPEIVLEAGNHGWDGHLASTADTMQELTTSNDLANPLSVIQGTSPATAVAGRIAAKIWRTEPDLRPETIRGLMVHSARWTEAMKAALPYIGDRLTLCGYGVPDLDASVRCLDERATVVVEDSMPAAAYDGENRRRLVKYFRLPSPEALEEAQGAAELSVTLSYFAQPTYGVRGRYERGLDLAWDMQGPAESEQEFMRRVNLLERPGPGFQNTTSSYQWEISKRRRGRGTVQSDRCEVAVSLLGGSRLIAVYPILGWWERKSDYRDREMPFSLIVTVKVPAGMDVYTPIAASLALDVSVDAGVV